MTWFECATFFCFAGLVWIFIELTSIKDELREIREIKEKEDEK